MALLVELEKVPLGGTIALCLAWKFKACGIAQGAQLNARDLRISSVKCEICNFLARIICELLAAATTRYYCSQME